MEMDLCSLQRFDNGFQTSGESFDTIL